METQKIINQIRLAQTFSTEAQLFESWGEFLSGGSVDEVLRVMQNATFVALSELEANIANFSIPTTVEIVVRETLSGVTLEKEKYEAVVAFGRGRHDAINDFDDVDMVVAMGHVLVVVCELCGLDLDWTIEEAAFNLGS